MALRSIEVIAQSREQCDVAEKRIKQALTQLSMEKKMKYTCEVVKTTDMRRTERFSTGARPPLVVINGILEFSGKIPEPNPLKMKLWNIIRFG